ncbi:MAG: CDP-diacylglycerol--serine O-phosphatidyltransferase [Dongiaceae bacterium]
MRTRSRPRLRDQSFNRLIPNILTVLALCAGLTSIRFAFQERWEMAVFAIVIAGVLDGLDGRIARLLDGSSKFGAELDSLSDFLAFGVAPALLLYYFTMKSVVGIGWALALLFAVCCALRLARFNTKVDNADLPAWTGRFFTGVPAPAGAGLALLPVFATFEFGSGFFDHPVVTGGAMVAVSLLMVSRVPTFSFKRIKVPHDYVLPTLLGVGLFAAFLVGTPWMTLMAVGVLYLASLPLSYVAYRRLSRQATDADLEDVEEGEDLPAD